MTATQTLIEGVIAPPPPVADKAFVAQALKEFIERHQLWPLIAAATAARSIAAQWRYSRDGYELARALEDFHGWDGITAEDVETFDGLTSVINCALSDARKAWAEAYNIQPPHPIGSRLITAHGRHGVIVALYEREAATYEVKEDGCTWLGRTLLVKFEDAKLKGGAA